MIDTSNLIEDTQELLINEIKRGLLVGSTDDPGIVLKADRKSLTMEVVFKGFDLTFHIPNPVFVKCLVDKNHNRIVLTDPEITAFLLSVSY